MFTQGWKDVLRPIRDGFRDLFPSPDKGPAPEERRRQQALDALDGFAYFDTFGQLGAWTPQDADTLQVANTPLLPRHLSSLNPQEGHAKVLLCHDLSGNYHRYEACQGEGVEREEYHCQYLQHVDLFVYFSHKLVCVPPPAWTNTLHRNGVKVLGTLLVERQTPGLERLLDESEILGREQFTFASQLAQVAEVYGFDGWLVNIEKKFSSDAWNPSRLLSFLLQLRQQMGEEKKLVWYDALTIDNTIEYQNSLTHKNIAFARTCGSLLTNYSWTEGGAAASKELAVTTDNNAGYSNEPRPNTGISSCAYDPIFTNYTDSKDNTLAPKASTPKPVLTHAIDPSNIYFGIDTWAQNASHGLSKRVTYPASGGGGTNVGIAVAKLASLGLSAGIFAPGWSFEHFPGQGAAIERCVWDGSDFPRDVSCDCGDAARHPTNRMNPVARHARVCPAGSGSFFYTDFGRAFSSHDSDLEEVYGGKKIHSRLGAQSILPLLPDPNTLRAEHRDDSDVVFAEIMDNPSRLVVYVERSLCRREGSKPITQSYHGILPLFKLNMTADAEKAIYRVRCKYKRLVRPDHSLRIHLDLGSRQNDHQTPHVKFPLEDSTNGNVVELTVLWNPRTTPTAETSASIQVVNTSSDDFRPAHAVPVIEIHELAIFQIDEDDATGAPLPCTIDGIRVESRSEGATRHRRLVWAFNEQGVPGSARQKATRLGRPYSNTTGVFGHFLVIIDDLCVGRAYAVEFVLNGVLAQKLKRAEVAKVRIVGVGFDGSERCESSEVLVREQGDLGDGEWCVVGGEDAGC